MVTAPITLAPLVVLAVLLLYAAISDWRTRTIDNWVSIAIAVTAPAWWALTGWSLISMAWQFGFAALVFALLFGLWSARLLGGADVKLIGALALWLPAGERVSTFFAMTVAGGAVALIAGVWAITWRRSTANIQVPYALAIAAGGATFLIRTIN